MSSEHLYHVKVHSVRPYIELKTRSLYVAEVQSLISLINRYENMNRHRQSAVFSGLSEKYFVRDEASWRSSSPSMPKLSPAKRRAAD